MGETEVDRKPVVFSCQKKTNEFNFQSLDDYGREPCEEPMSQILYGGGVNLVGSLDDWRSLAKPFPKLSTGSAMSETRAAGSLCWSYIGLSFVWSGGSFYILSGKKKMEKIPFIQG